MRRERKTHPESRAAGRKRVDRQFGQYRKWGQETDGAKYSVYYFKGTALPKIKDM